MHPTGKPSRKTGLHLFLSDLYKNDTQRGETWEQKRTRIFTTALERWKTATYEMMRVRERYSKMAKDINKKHNVDRCIRLMIEDDKASVQKGLDSQMANHQLHVLTATLQGNMLCSNGLTPSVPSVVRPHALTDFAQQQSLLPLPDIDSSSDAIVMCDDTDPNMLVGRNLSESAMFLTNHGLGLHGLGDQEFGVSQALVEAMSERKGFVNDSDRQFQAAHAHVCDKEIPFTSVGTEDELEARKSCQELCGRFCRNDITDVTMFRNFVEMIKTIARIVSSRRDVKHGSTVFMSPTCKLPVLIIQTPNGLFARLSSRFSFSPLEVDWLHCNIEAGGASDDDVLYRVILTFHALDDSSYLCSSSDNMCELAIWLCRNFVAGPESKCQLFLNYDLDEHYDHILLLRSHHLSSASVSPDGDSFHSLLVEKQKKRPIRDEDEELDSIGMMLSVLSDKNKKKKQGSSKQTGKKPISNALQLLAGRPTGISAAFVTPVKLFFFDIIV